MRVRCGVVGAWVLFVGSLLAAGGGDVVSIAVVSRKYGRHSHEAFIVSRSWGREGQRAVILTPALCR